MAASNAEMGSIRVNISIIVSIWKLPPLRLYQSLWQLSHQTETPHEIIVVNSSPDSEMRYEVAETCERFPLSRCIDAPQDVSVFNLSRSSNIGIRHTTAQSEYIGIVPLDLLYARNFIEALAETAERNVCCEAPMGALKMSYDLKDIETLWDRWAEVLEHLYENPPSYTFAPGGISCIRREWFFEVRGYDEEKYSFSYGDSDLLYRARLCGINIKPIPWDKTQILHIEHPLRFGIQASLPDVRDIPIVRNPNSWGEI